MPCRTVICAHPDTSRQLPHARVGDPVVPWGKARARDALSQAADTTGCEPARAIIRRMRFAQD